MDWYAWLSKSGLEDSQVHEYAILFYDNELEEEDIAHLDHAFLQSMGVSVAKHRLEILKHAGNQGGGTRWRKRRRIPSPLAAAVKNCLARYVTALSCSRGIPAAVLSPLGAASPAGGHGDCSWGGGVASRRKAKLALLTQGRLVITDRGVSVVAHPSPPRSLSACPSPMVVRGYRENGGGDRYPETGDDGGMRWETMFRNMKPT